VSSLWQEKDDTEAAIRKIPGFRRARHLDGAASERRRSGQLRDAGQDWHLAASSDVNAELLLELTFTDPELWSAHLTGESLQEINVEHICVGQNAVVALNLAQGVRHIAFHDRDLGIWQSVQVTQISEVRGLRWRSAPKVVLVEQHEGMGSDRLEDNIVKRSDVLFELFKKVGVRFRKPLNREGEREQRRLLFLVFAVCSRGKVALKVS
jgi:hypothetical protein